MRLAAAAAPLLLAAAARAGNTVLGCNPTAPGNRQQLLADLVKVSLFGQPGTPGDQNTTVDARGWPSQDFSLQFYNEPGGFYYPAVDISGVYTITALGCGTVVIPTGFGGLTIANQSCPGGNLLAYMTVSADGDAVHGRGAVAFLNTTRGPGLGAGLTNVSLLLPGYSPGTDPDTLHEPALANIRGRCAVSRVIGWAMYGPASWSTATPPTPCDWSIRPRPGDPTYVLGGWGTKGLGVPYEIIAKFVNAVGTDVWINLPTTANETARDEYVTELVKLFDALLPAGRKVFLEWGNECMFGNNQCYDDDETLANNTVLQKGDPYKLNLGLPSPPNATANLATWGTRAYAWTALRLAQLAGAVVGPQRVGRADTPGVRVVPVLGGNGGDPDDGWGKLGWLTEAWGAPAAQGLATVNIGAYVGAAANVTHDPAVTVDQVIASMQAAIAAASPASPTAYFYNSPLSGALSGYAAAAAYYGVALHAYEGGPDTSNGVGAGVLTLGKACADPRMADVVAGVIGLWQAWGGGTFNYFQLGAAALEQPWGSYANLWDLRVPDTPKSAGIDRVVSAPPVPLGAGWPAPLVQHNVSFFVSYWTPSGLPPTTPYVSWLPLGTSMHYLVRFPAAAACPAGVNVTVSYSSTAAAGAMEPLEVSVGAFLPATNASLAATSGPTLAAATVLFPAAEFPSGLVAVRLLVPVAKVQYTLWFLDVACRSA